MLRALVTARVTSADALPDTRATRGVDAPETSDLIHLAERDRLGIAGETNRGSASAARLRGGIRFRFRKTPERLSERPGSMRAPDRTPPSSLPATGGTSSPPAHPAHPTR